MYESIPVLTNRRRGNVVLVDTNNYHPVLDGSINQRVQLEAEYRPQSRCDYVLASNRVHPRRGLN